MSAFYFFSSHLSRGRTIESGIIVGITVRIRALKYSIRLFFSRLRPHWSFNASIYVTCALLQKLWRFTDRAEPAGHYEIARVLSDYLHAHNFVS
jgi:hypothetical protein